MPLYRLFAPPATFSKKDKAEISQRITDFYTGRGLPAFYVVVLFIDVPEESFYVGGKAKKNFVRIVTQHLARTVPKEEWPRMLNGIEATYAPYIKDRGLEWELHVEEHERELWRSQGLDPPPSKSEAEKQWVEKNKATPY